MAPLGGDIKFVFHRSKSKFPTLSHAKNIFCISLSKKKLQNFWVALKKRPKRTEPRFFWFISILDCFWVVSFSGKKLVLLNFVLLFCQSSTCLCALLTPSFFKTGNLVESARRDAKEVEPRQIRDNILANYKKSLLGGFRTLGNICWYRATTFGWIIILNPIYPIREWAFSRLLQGFESLYVWKKN